jgi:hypothetical protein
MLLVQSRMAYLFAAQTAGVVLSAGLVSSARAAAGAASANIRLVCNAAGDTSLIPGIYVGALWIVNNDPAAQQARLPVRLTVAPPPGWLRLPLLQR